MSRMQLAIDEAIACATLILGLVALLAIATAVVNVWTGSAWWRRL